MSSSEDELEKQRKLEKKLKKEKKKRKRELEEATENGTSESSPMEVDTELIATMEADNELGANKRHKKEKKEKEQPPETTELTKEEEKAAKKAKKAAKRAREAEREEEVMAAHAIAVQEEKDEEEALESERKKAKKEKKQKQQDQASEEEAKQPEETPEERAARKQAKKEKKERKAREAAAAAASTSSSTSTSTSTAAAAAATTTSDGTPAAAKRWPTPPPGNTTLLLFYQYVRPNWTPSQRQHAEDFARDSLTRHGCTGRLRCSKEGFNSTLTGPKEGIRAFCQDLREYQPEHFANTDFKFVDGLRDNQMLRGLKVWHVDELVTYGFGHTKGIAPIEAGGTHLSPRDWHNKAAEDNTVLIDVRNANENAIGRFQPLNDPYRVLDPLMRTSTEFPDWVTENMPKLQAAKNIMMYCTGGIRCERASALLVQKGLPPSKVYQLEGGIHRYLEEFKDGGHWVGKNYVFDRRFAHGATEKTPEVVGRCACCSAPWDRYQAGKKCFLCRMEVLVCRECERSGKMKTVKLKCFLCGGPKPSYLAPDQKTINFKKKKQYGEKEPKDNDY